MATPEAYKPEKESVDLIPIETLIPAEVFTPVGVDAIIKKVEEKVAAFVPDISTAKGRSAVKSFADQIRRSKTGIDSMRKDYGSDLKKKVDSLNAMGKRIRDRLDELIKEVMAPVDEFEKKEEERIQRIQDRIAWFSKKAAVVDEEGEPFNAEHLQRSLQAVSGFVINDFFEEFTDQAREEKQKAVESLGKAIEIRVKYEREQEELARLRKEADEREAREKAENQVGDMLCPDCHYL